MTADDHLAALTADPRNDERLLAYADSLAAGKDPRGEFIRIQVALEQPALDPQERDRLARREKSLLRKHAADWNAELPAWARHHAPRFVRGFPEVRCEVTDWLRGAKQLAARMPLHRVNMKATATTLPRLAGSAELERVELLDLSNSPLDDASFAEFISSPHLKGLASLYLWQCRLGPEAARALAAAPHLSALRKLELSENRIGAGVAALAESRVLRNLNFLSPWSNHVGPDGATALVGSPILERLTTLSLGNNDCGGAALPLIVRAPGSLERFDLEGNALGDAGAEALAAATQLDRLTALDLTYDGIGPAGAKALAGAKHLVSLRVLRLNANPVGSAGAKALAGSRVLSQLSELHLDSSEIGDAGAEAIARSKHLSKLRTLDLRDSQIGPAGGAALVEGPALDALESLVLSRNAIDAETKRALRERFGKRVSF